VEQVIVKQGLASRLTTEQASTVPFSRLLCCFFVAGEGEVVGTEVAVSLSVLWFRGLDAIHNPMRAAQQPANYRAASRLQLQCMKCSATFKAWKRRKNCKVRA
jgi:hypothetical protein